MALNSENTQKRPKIEPAIDNSKFKSNLNISSGYKSLILDDLFVY